MHRFPKDKSLCLLWLKAIDREDLLEAELINYRVCDRHFSVMWKVPNANKTCRTNLKWNAIPDQHLKGDKVAEVVTFSHAPAASGQSEEDQEMADVSTVFSESDRVEEGVTMFDDQEMTDLPCSSHSLEAMEEGPIMKPRVPIKTGSRRFLRLLQKLPSNPRELYAVARDLKRTNQRLRRQNSKNKFVVTKSYRYKVTRDYLRATLNKTSFNFVTEQLELQPKKSHGRRYSEDAKIYALTLMKQSARGYRLLHKTFALPSRRTLMRLLHKVQFKEGINPHIMRSLAEQVINMNPLDRHCVLMFDEMSIQPGLSYNKQADVIEGFQHTSSKIAFVDHVMVFMIRGVRREWKQPISYHFSENGMNAEDLSRNIKEVIQALFDIGLVVVATLCDQMSVNSKAIRNLYEATDRLYQRAEKENRNFGFEVRGKEIIPLYDPPHLLKGLRNNFCDYDAVFMWKGKKMKASWKDLLKMYEIDEGDKHTRMLNRLTDAHVIKAKLKKMKVSYAAQIFSHRVSSTIRGLANRAPGLLPLGAAETAEFLCFGDQLFDSVNGSTPYPQNGKDLRCAVRDESEHHEFWQEAVGVLRSCKFIKPNGSQFAPPTVPNWIKTIEGMKYLWRNLRRKGFKYLATRNLNQDPWRISLGV